LVGKKPEVSNIELECLKPVADEPLQLTPTETSQDTVSTAFLTLINEQSKEIDRIITEFFKEIAQSSSGTAPSSSTSLVVPTSSQTSGLIPNSTASQIDSIVISPSPSSSSSGSSDAGLIVISPSQPSSTSSSNSTASQIDSIVISPSPSSSGSSDADSMDKSLQQTPTLTTCHHVGFFDLEYFSAPPRAWQISIILPFLGKSFCSYIRVDPTTVNYNDLSSLRHIGMEYGTWEVLMNRAQPADTIAEKIQEFFKNIDGQVDLYHYQGSDQKQMGILMANNQLPNVKTSEIGFPLLMAINNSKEKESDKRKSASLRSLHGEMSVENSTFRRLGCSASDHDARVDTLKLAELMIFWMRTIGKLNHIPNESQAHHIISSMVETYNNRETKRRPSSNDKRPQKQRRYLEPERERTITAFVSKKVEVSGKLRKKHMIQFLETITKKKPKSNSTLLDLAALIEVEIESDGK